MSRTGALLLILLMAACVLAATTITNVTSTTITTTNMDASGRVTIPAADLVVGTCTVNTIANDTGGATKEHCVCGTTNVWGCWKLSDGTFNANGPAD
jgi:hypothetical protein